MKLFRLLLMLVAIAVTTACSDDDDGSYMNLSQKTADVKAAGGEVTLVVNANVRYVVNHDCDWINIHSAVTEGDATTFGISVMANDVTEERTGRIKFIGDDVTPKAFDIHQAAFTPTGVSVNEIKVEADATSAEFEVLCEGAWSATSSNPDFVLTPTTGVDNTNVTVAFPANGTAQEVSAVITVTIGDKQYTVTIKQAGLSITLITEWAIDKMKDEYANTWGAETFDKSVAGFISPYANPSTGTGSIRFYNSDKSARPDDGKGMRTQTGSHGDLMMRGFVTTDYWLLECGNELLSEIPAGKPMRFEFTGHIYGSTCGYWMAEYLDGSDWKPLMQTKTITLTATEGLSGAKGNWSETVTYNYAYTKDGIYQLFEGTFTLTKPCEKVQIRLRPAAEITITGKYIDQISQSTCTRFTAQHPHDGDKAVKEYNQTVKLEFVQ